MNKIAVGEEQRTPAQVADATSQKGWWQSVRVCDIMSTTVLCVDSLTTVTEAQAIMKEQRIRRLPVIDEGKLVGIVTQGDVRGALPSEVTTLNRAEQEYLMKQVKVSRMMHSEVITVAPETTLADAARLMVKYKIGGLPVVEAGNVIGMVTESDIFGTVVKMFDSVDKA
ncbi:MAG: CBS domain-containing protein [Caldilineaceae bacterium]